MVNNAGVFAGLHTIVDETKGQYDFRMAVNVKSVWLGVGSPSPRCSGRRILRQEEDTGAEPAYCASKGAVVNLTCQLAVDYAPERINVNAICPGFLATAMVRPFLDDPELNKTVHDLSPWPYLGTAEVFRDPRTDDRERGRVGRVPRLRRRRDGDESMQVLDGGYTAG